MTIYLRETAACSKCKDKNVCGKLKCIAYALKNQDIDESIDLVIDIEHCDLIQRRNIATLESFISGEKNDLQMEVEMIE